MTRRFLSLLAALVLCSSMALAQDAAPPDVSNGKVAVQGSIKGDAVQVRSGPGENYYPTSKLNKGDTVTVVGSTFEWLKIVPPEGSFCYIAKAYVERRGDGSAGRVVKDDAVARAGSALSTLKYAPVCKLAKDEDVVVLGEQDEYFKIKPPKNAYFFVKKEFVLAVKELGDVHVGDGPRAENGPGGNEILSRGATSNPTSGPTIGGGVSVVVTPPTTQASDLAATEFDRLEDIFKALDTKALEAQPLAETLAGYEKLIADGNLPFSMRRIADRRINFLRDRNDAQQKLAEASKSRQEAEAKRLALEAEHQELVDRQKALGVTTYAAVGALQTSSLQLGGETLYRLTDPANGHTICYVRSGDSKTVNFLGQFVGVNGEVGNEQQLPMKVVTAKEIAAVDPAKVGNGVIAPIVPSSILIKAGSASTGNP